jgi:hypothetical protein
MLSPLQSRHCSSDQLAEKQSQDILQVPAIEKLIKVIHFDVQ